MPKVGYKFPRVHDLTLRQAALLQSYVDNECDYRKAVEAEYISYCTFKSHIDQIFKAWNVSNKAQMVVEAIRRGVVKI